MSGLPSKSESVFYITEVIAVPELNKDSYSRWGTPKVQAIHKTHIMWKGDTPPPIPSIRDTNDQINTIFDDEPYGRSD